MSEADKPSEGGLEASVRHPVPWREDSFYEREEVDAELERVFDICHGCRRCFSLCASFPTLFELIDESASGETEDVAKADYAKVSEQCFLCDLCYQTKCPYVPPHPWQVDFPHLMLRDKAAHFRAKGASWRDRLITSTTTVGRLASTPLLDRAVNAANRTPLLRKALEKTAGIDARARLPRYHSHHLGKRLSAPCPPEGEAQPAGPTRGRVAIFGTCYGRWNRPDMAADLAAVLAHNQIPAALSAAAQCCGMPKMELGDLATVDQLRAANIPPLLEAVEQGCDILAPVPSCVLMFRQELPLLFPEDEAVQRVAAQLFDPFEYLMHRHRAGLLNTDFPGGGGGRVLYHAACHWRVQNLGACTRQLLQLLPNTEVDTVEHCSGHNGTYAVRAETRDNAMKITAPVLRAARAKDADGGYDEYTSDCPLAADHIVDGLEPGTEREAPHPISLLRRAYGI